MKTPQFPYSKLAQSIGVSEVYLKREDLDHYGSHKGRSIPVMIEIYEKKHNIKIQKTYYCSHKPDDNCECRKPKIKFLKEAEKEFGIDLKKSFVIGDKKSDFEMGRNAGCKTIHVLTGYGLKYKKDVKPDYFAKDLVDAVKWILKTH